MERLLVIVALLVSAAVGDLIQWTNAGGNPLWEEPRNWDKLRVPNQNDDVVINLANIPGNVRIAAVPAAVNSLIVGGSSSFSQALTVQGLLTVGQGGAKILPNGNVILQSSPDLPLVSIGTFLANDRLVFISGSLSGAGSFEFTNVNFSGPALKQLNSTVSVSNTLLIDPGSGATGAVTIASGTLSVAGAIRTSQSLILSSAVGAQLIVSGTFSFTAASASYSASIAGKAIIQTLNVAAGTVTLSDAVTVATSSVASGANINLIGALSATRSFGDISGQGTLNIQGGTNSFTTITNIGSVVLSGGSLVVDTKAASIASLTQTGGTITGKAQLSIGNLLLANAQIVNTPISASTVTLKGFTSLTSASLTITNRGTISVSSQITLASGASTVVGTNAVVTQTAGFKLLPAGTGVAPVFTVNGKWSSSSDLQIVVNTQGAGSFSFATGSTTTVTGINFSIGSIVLTSASFTVIGSHVTAGVVAGSGNIVNEGETFTVTSSINAAKYTQTNGQSTFATGTISSLDIQNGQLLVTGPPLSSSPYLTATSFTFEGGNIASTAPQNTIASTAVTITGTEAHTFTNLTLNAQALNFDCGTQQCQIFTVNAHIHVGPQYNALLLADSN